MSGDKDRAGRLLDAAGQRYFKGERYGARGEAKEHVKSRHDRTEKYDRGRSVEWTESRKERDRLGAELAALKQKHASWDDMDSKTWYEVDKAQQAFNKSREKEVRLRYKNIPNGGAKTAQALEDLSQVDGDFKGYYDKIQNQNVNYLQMIVIYALLKI